MSPEESPFEILGLSASAEPEVIDAAHRAMARKYHPDLNPGASQLDLNARMSRINWARDQLVTNAEHWRRQSPKGRSTPGRHPASDPPPEATTNGRYSAGSDIQSEPQGVVSVHPALVNLVGRKGSRGQFEASAGATGSADIRARFASDSLINVERLPTSGTTAHFSVEVVDDFPSDVPDNVVERVEIVAPGYRSAPIFVSIASLSLDTVLQKPGTRVAPTQHVLSSARIAFGKHRGRTFHQIAVDEPGYLEWVLQVGAGSHTERECATLALSEVRSGRHHSPHQPHSPKPDLIGEKTTPTPKTIGRSPGRPAAPAVQSPRTDRGILAAVRALLPLRRKGP